MTDLCDDRTDAHIKYLHCLNNLWLYFNSANTMNSCVRFSVLCILPDYALSSFWSTGLVSAFVEWGPPGFDSRVDCVISVQISKMVLFQFYDRNNVARDRQECDNIVGQLIVSSANRGCIDKILHLSPIERSLILRLNFLCYVLIATGSGFARVVVILSVFDLNSFVFIMTYKTWSHIIL